MYNQREATGKPEFSGMSFAAVVLASLSLASPFDLHSGKVSFTGDTMNGNITAKANVGGKDVEMQNKISARRVGGC